MSSMKKLGFTEAELMKELQDDRSHIAMLYKKLKQGKQDLRDSRKLGSFDRESIEQQHYLSTGINRY